MRKKNLMLIAGVGVLATSQLTGCSSITKTLKERFIVEDTVADVESSPAFGYSDVGEINSVVVKNVEEIDSRPFDTTGNLSEIISNLGIVTKLGKTEEENIILNIKESLDKFAVEDELIVVYEEEIYPEIIEERKKESKSNKYTEEEDYEDEPKEFIEVEIVNHKIGNDKSKLVELDDELKSLGYKLDNLSAIQYFNDYDYESFVGDNITIDITDLEVGSDGSLGYNDSQIGAILTKLNSMTSDKTKYVNMTLVYNLGAEGDLTNNITLNVGLDFINNKLLYISYSVFNHESDAIKKFTYTKDNLVWADVISDIPSEEVFFDGLYEGSVETYITQREVVKDKFDSNIEVKDKKSDIDGGLEEIEYEDINKVASFTLTKFVSEESQNYVDTKVLANGIANDALLENKIDYLGEVSINNKSISINNIIDSKDFSVVMSNIELYKAKPYKVRLFTSASNYEEIEVSSFEEINLLYKQYKGLDAYTRCNFEVYFTAPGGLTFMYEFNNIDGELKYVEFTVYRGVFVSEKVVEELTDYIRLEDRVIEDIESDFDRNKKTDYIEESDKIAYKFITKIDKENFVKTTIDKDSGVKYTSYMLDISDVSLSKIVEGLEKTETGFIGNGQKYRVELEVDSSEIISYSLGRYWD